MTPSDRNEILSVCDLSFSQSYNFSMRLMKMPAIEKKEFKLLENNELDLLAHDRSMVYNINQG